MARIGIDSKTTDGSFDKNILSNINTVDKTIDYEQNVKAKMSEYLNDKLNNLECMMNKNSISLGSSKMSHKSGVSDLNKVAEEMRRNSSDGMSTQIPILEAKDIEISRPCRKSPKLMRSGLEHE